MKVIIENAPVTYVPDRDLLKDDIEIMWAEFAMIVSVANNCKNEQSLRFYFDKMIFNHFVNGFGSHHMWIKQRGDCPNRILFIEF